MATRYKELLQERADLVAEAGELFKAAEAEGRGLTDEEKARDDEIQVRLDALDDDLVREERRRERERQVAAAGNGVSVPGRIVSVHDRAEDQPWDSMGQWLVAIAAAGTPGGRIDPRLYAGPSGMNTSVPSEGGFLARKDWTLALLQRGMEESQLAPLCTPLEIGEESDGVEAPYVAETSRATGSRWGGVQVYRRAEAETVTATKPTLEKFDLRLEDLMGIAYMTERTLRDATAMQSIMSTAFASEFGFRLDDEIIRGTGAGQCMGVLNAPSLVTIDAETGQAAASIVTENISKMWSRLWVRSRGRATWFFNQDCEPQLDQLALIAGTGALEPRVASYSEAGVLRIKGRPTVALEQCETLGTVGDLLLLDLSEYILIRKGGIVPAESIHVRFLYNERAFRWVYAINGAPKWKTTLTPYKRTGSATVSPFVALATRS